MTEHRTMNTVIHAAFRRDLRRFDQALQAFPHGDQQRAIRLCEAWGNLAFQLDHHHTDEETIFWPALMQLGAADALLGDLEAEHATMLAALDATDAAMASFRAEPSSERAAQAHAAVAELTSVLLGHLAHEEHDMEPVSAAHHDAPQIKRAQKQVRRAHRGNTGTLFAWLQDGADADALAGLRREVPAPVLWVITRTAGRDYRRRIAPTWS